MVVMVVLAGVAPVTAAEPARCVSGPASEASATRPHVVDPSDDLHLLAGRGDNGDRDVLAAWVSQEVTETSAGPLRLTLALAASPGSAEIEHIVEYADDRYVMARGSGSRFRFSYGRVERRATGVGNGSVTSYPEEGLTSGEVGRATISILLPSATLPRTTSEGGRLSIDRFSSRSVYSLVGYYGFSTLADDSSNAQRCTATFVRPDERPDETGSRRG